MSLYSTLRPKSFDEIVGNSATVESLKNIVKMKPSLRPHTFLFTGTRGTGKTTSARILVKEFGCASIDLMELNGADNRGIDDARRVINVAHVSPMGGDCRIFIYDEYHKATGDNMNALLKIIEDVPKSTYFIFCSTEPDKILKTIKNRCTIYRFELLSERDMEELITTILDKLDKSIPDNVYWKIIDASEGCPRQAIVLLEQVLTVESEQSQLDILKKAQIEHEVVDLCRILLKGGNWKQVVTIYKGLPDVEPEQVRRAINGYMKNVLLNNGSPRAAVIISYLEDNLFNSGEAGLVKSLFELISL